MYIDEHANPVDPSTGPSGEPNLLAPSQLPGDDLTSDAREALGGTDGADQHAGDRELCQPRALLITAIRKRFPGIWVRAIEKGLTALLVAGGSGLLVAIWNSDRLHLTLVQASWLVAALLAALCWVYLLQIGQTMKESCLPTKPECSINLDTGISETVIVGTSRIDPSPSRWQAASRRKWLFCEYVLGALVTGAFSYWIVVMRHETTPDVFTGVRDAGAAAVFFGYAVTYENHATRKAKLLPFRILWSKTGKGASRLRQFIEPYGMLRLFGADGNVRTPPIVVLLLVVGWFGCALMGSASARHEHGAHDAARGFGAGQATGGAATVTSGGGSSSGADAGSLAPGGAPDDSSSTGGEVTTGPDSQGWSMIEAPGINPAFICNQSEQTDVDSLTSQDMPRGLAKNAVDAYRADTRALGCPGSATTLNSMTWQVAFPTGEDSTALVISGARGAQVVRRPISTLITMDDHASEVTYVDERVDWGLGNLQYISYEDSTCRLAQTMAGQRSILVPSSITMLAAAVGIHDGAVPAIHLRPEPDAQGRQVFAVELYQAAAGAPDGWRRIRHADVTLQFDGSATSPGSEPVPATTPCGTTNDDLIQAANELRVSVNRARVAAGRG
jgi:hypothetical protein